MPFRYWHRLLIFYVGSAIYRLFNLKLFNGIDLPFTPVTAYGHIGRPSGLKFLLEIAARGAYTGFRIAEGAETGILYDVGANCGFFTLIRCLEHQTLRAYCFEPHPYTFSTLVTNIRLNRLQDRVIPVNAAVGRHTGTLSISISRSSSMAVVVPESLQEESPTHVIPAVSLDDFSHARQRPDSIKIDVEGHEEQVLLGARQVLTTTKRLVVEVHSHKLEESCRQLLTESGFRIVKHGSLLFCDKSPES